jgi:hypothetical protein
MKLVGFLLPLSVVILLLKKEANFGGQFSKFVASYYALYYALLFCCCDLLNFFRDKRFTTDSLMINGSLTKDSLTKGLRLKAQKI